MDPINGLNQIAEILRQKISERSSPLTRKEIESQVSTESSLAGVETRINPDQIKRKISERIKGLPEKDRRGKRAAQIFVEMVLSWEFGENLFQDPKFTEMSHDVADAMVNDPTIWGQMQQLLKELEKSS